ncbi:lytic transglycosylase domain-containing protein [Rubellimicrobium sp. CFH 75288]|uniref:lytic transglycosylase domain-containing protein n=1 Tax=Rubellimicrobium sp. CFH 75288 TaxID=2697034 RepID=UPI0014127EA1|nr:lytic transglycosylase domain-containing protein [Rubellimicrobium sp. CFH 75288]NAZ37283.1 lytic transglycosylase domain-containing protein [Rubellimicrobium sp. CFH 75288]
MIRLSAPPGRLAAVALLCLLTGPDPALGDESDLCLRAAADAARLSGVPAAVLAALTLTETGRGSPLRPWPWAVHAEGQGHWFPTREEAVAFAEGRVAAGVTNLDIGCFQLNWRWHGEHFVSPAQMLDPLANASYAAAFLNRLRSETDGWSAAAGAFHSRSPDHAARYRARFDAQLAALDRGGRSAGPAPTAAGRARGPLPLLHAGGAAPRLGSLVPLDG